MTTPQKPVSLKNILLLLLAAPFVMAAVFFAWYWTGLLEQPESSAATSAPHLPTPSASAPAPQRPPTSITAWRFEGAYRQNEVSADRLYKGKALRVTGTVAGVNRDASGKIVVSFQGWHEDSSISALGLLEQEAGSLIPGQEITLECEGGGMVAGIPMLHKCRPAPRGER